MHTSVAFLVSILLVCRQYMFLGEHWHIIPSIRSSEKPRSQYLAFLPHNISPSRQIASSKQHRLSQELHNVGVDQSLRYALCVIHLYLAVRP
jgi:hypothetical protein